MTGAKRLAVYVAVLLAGVAIVAGLRVSQLAHQEVRFEQAPLEIPPGTSSRKAASLIVEAGFPGSSGVVFLVHRLFGDPSSIKAGSYLLDGNLRLVDLFGIIEEGRVSLVEVTISEGLAVKAIGALLEDAGVIESAEEFVALGLGEAAPAEFDLPGPTLEGYLYPDTYRFARGLTSRDVVGTMVDRFRQEWDKVGRDNSGLDLTLAQTVTLASIIEKETGKAEERPLVASVFVNRLKKRMRLETDPTVIYGIVDFDGNLRRADLKRDTPYNTYTRPGLPPGPIASPGLASLKAARNPAATDFFYFVSRNDSTHVFAETYSEHRKNVDRFQRRKRR